MGDRLTEIKKRLDITDSVGRDLFWPDFNADWTVV
jgi:hypothetical protein